MKKLNLLLATTAILSMGTMAANAGDELSPDATLDVHVNIVQPSRVYELQDIDFATLISNYDGDHYEVTMNSTTGSLTAPEGILLVGTPKNGLVEISMANANLQTLSLPSSVTLSNDDGEEVTYRPDFAVTRSVAVGENYVTKTFGIGGVLRVDDGVGIIKGDFTGVLEITRIEDTGE